jgi:heavy metal-binding protein/methylamine utilization protein MauE
MGNRDDSSTPGVGAGDGSSDMTTYRCPMHPDVRSDEPGRCPTCGMRLVPEDQIPAGSHPQKEQTRTTSDIRQYRPLIVIIGLIALATLALALRDAQRGEVQWQNVMTTFMAGFFLVFAGFKLLDLKGFADGYATYDLLARRMGAYGYAYPFIELLLGLAYLVQFRLPITNIITVVVMTFSGLGVALKVAKREPFTCVCLGTVFKVPLTTVTLVEDFGMALMALAALVVS